MIYQHTHEINGAVIASRVIAPIVLSQLPKLNSILDVGGGAGAWAAAFKHCGVPQVRVQDDISASGHLLVSREEFEDLDFRKGFPTSEPVDLVVCLEVAEHLPRGKEILLVDYLTACSDRILFSAAVPGQGGVGHINCRPHDFWLELFKQRGYIAHDSVRPKILNNLELPYWYRQNIFIFSKNDGEICQESFIGSDMDVINKEVLHYLENPSTSQAFKMLRAAIVKALRRRLFRI